MLQYNPYFRPSVKQLLKNKLFDEVRMDENQMLSPIKIVINIDKNEYSHQYEKGKVKIKERDKILAF